jgi:hypothetical protein
VSASEAGKGLSPQYQARPLFLWQAPTSLKNPPYLTTNLTTRQQKAAISGGLFRCRLIIKVVLKSGFEPIRYCYRQHIKTIRLGLITNNDVALPTLFPSICQKPEADEQAIGVDILLPNARACAALGFRRQIDASGRPDYDDYVSVLRPLLNRDDANGSLRLLL